jgi:glyoxylase-like metal-dependent hydrolase (beta-lactamase superfamily II)
VREVVDGVFEIGIGYVHAHLIVVDDGVVLVDTGLPGKADRIERALHDVRRTVGDVTTILLTHRHPDHTGSVAELRRRSGARVVAHTADTPGHTAGHVSYLLDRAGGVLFAGDAASGGPGGRVGRSPGPVTDDREKAAASVARLAELDFDVAVFGHGPAVTGRAVDRFRKLAAG